LEIIKPKRYLVYETKEKNKRVSKKEKTKSIKTQ